MIKCKMTIGERNSTVIVDAGEPVLKRRCVWDRRMDAEIASRPIHIFKQRLLWVDRALAK